MVEVAVLPALQILQVTPAEGYRISARALLAGFAVEAALKSFLASRLPPLEILAKSPYGHDLEELWREACAHGLDTSATAPDWCLRLNELTGKPNFFARYHTSVHGLSYPVQAEMISGIRELVAKTEASFRP